MQFSFKRSRGTLSAAFSYYIHGLTESARKSPQRALGVSKQPSMDCYCPSLSGRSLWPAGASPRPRGGPLTFRGGWGRHSSWPPEGAASSARTRRSPRTIRAVLRPDAPSSPYRLLGPSARLGGRLLLTTPRCEPPQGRRRVLPGLAEPPPGVQGWAGGL